MPYFLRVIRKPRWYLERALAYLDTGQFPADPLADLNTQDNLLSVWHVEDDQSNLARIVTALAANRERLDKLDYALIDHLKVQELQMKVERSSGGTPDRIANDWHRDICELSALNLTDLAKAILPERDKRHRVSAKEIQQRIREAIQSGRIDTDRLKPQLKAKLEQTQG